MKFYAELVRRFDVGFVCYEVLCKAYYEALCKISKMKIKAEILGKSLS